MAKVKEVSSYSGSAWGTAVPIGANATNVDMATNPTDYDSSTSETSTTLIGTNDVKVISSDTDLTAWGKFNRFRKRADNAINAIENGLAIIVEGDICTTAVPAGGYAYIKNNTHGLTEGLYRNKTTSAFPTTGGTANSTVFEYVGAGGLNALNDNLIDHFYYLGHNSDSFTIAANSVGATIVININTEYTPLGIVGIESFSGHLAISEFRLSNDKTKVALQIKNTSSSALTGSIKVYVLYIK